METIKKILLLCLVPVVVSAADPPRETELLPVGLFDRDVIGYFSGSVYDRVERYEGDANLTGRKSPLLAGIMSAAVPGSGEFYVGRYWRALAHFGIELTAWSFYFHYDARGDDQTDLYKAYANRHWSVVRYAEWLNQYWGGTIQINPDTGLPPWQRVSWSDIHQVESSESQFSHRLEPYGTQQYYELIGKYPQYNRGWEDSIPLEDVNAERIAYFDDISEMFSYYSGKRGYANTLYARAHNALLVVFLNHFASAFHAAFLAHIHNESNLTVDLEQRHSLYGNRYIPTVRLQVGF
jgi:hypothetical protein